MSYLQTIHFKLDFQKVYQHTVGNWLIHGTKAAGISVAKAETPL